MDNFEMFKHWSKVWQMNPGDQLFPSIRTHPPIHDVFLLFTGTKNYVYGDKKYRSLFTLQHKEEIKGWWCEVEKVLIVYG